MRSQPEETKLFTGKFDSPLAVAKQALRSMEKGKLVTGREKGHALCVKCFAPESNTGDLTLIYGANVVCFN